MVGAVMADGWWRGQLSWFLHRNVYGERLGLLAQLEITYTDASVERIVTDESWRRPRVRSWPPISTTVEATTRASNFQAGRRRPSTTPDGGRSSISNPRWACSWRPGTTNPAHRIASCSPGADRSFRPHDPRLRPEPRRMGAPARRPGRVRCGDHHPARRGARGRRARRPAAALRQGHRHVPAVGGVDAFEPTFTFHGFRYAEVDGWPGGALPTAEDLEAVVVHSDLTGIGTLECSDEQLNQLHAMSSGRCAATSSTSRPTAHSATSASAGPATSPSSRRQRHTCTTCPASSTTGWPTSQQSRAPMAQCLSLFPTCPTSSCRRSLRVGVMLRRSSPGSCSVGSATATCSSGSSTACARRWTT